MSDVYQLIRFYNYDLMKVEATIMHIYEIGSISEKLMCAYMQELDNYY